MHERRNSLARHEDILGGGEEVRNWTCIITHPLFIYHVSSHFSIVHTSLYKDLQYYNQWIGIANGLSGYIQCRHEEFTIHTSVHGLQIMWTE